MSTSVLNIAGVNVPFFSKLPISIDKSIADIREPDKRNADFSKTITVPATKPINILFEFAFDVNIDFQSFNPNIKVPGSYFVDSIEIIRGNIQLLSIPLLRDEGSYEIAIKGTNADLFLNLGDAYLTALDFSALNHSLDYTNFSAAPTLGVGYCYGYIDYGMAGVNGWNWNVLHMKASIFLLEYIKKIFTYAGKTFTSTYINGAEFSRFAVPCSKPGMYQFSGSQIANNQFLASRSSDLTYISAAALTYTASGFNRYTYYLAAGATVLFNDDFTAPNNDPGGLYNPANGRYTVNIQSSFLLVANLNLDFKISAIATAASFVGNLSYILQVRKNGAIVSSFTYNTANLSLSGFTAPVSGGFATYNISRFVTYNAVNSQPGDYYEIKIMGITLSGDFYTAGSAQIVTGAASALDLIVKTTSKYYGTLTTTALTWGSTIDMNTVIPDEIKMKDFLMWVLLTFNLYIEQDKANANNYIIERRNDFYTTGNELDLNSRHDTSQEWKIIPMGELDSNSYVLKFDDDGDYWNKTYLNKWQETYGQQRTIITNDFLKKERVIKVGFAPTPGVSFQTDIVAPRLLTIEGTFPGGTWTAKPTKTKPRLLYWAGQKSCMVHNLVTSATTTLNNQATYPSLNHFDDAINPTIDINFGLPRELFWTLPAQQYTTNNLGNSGWNDYFSAISNKNSKIVQIKAQLSPLDMYNFTFRRRAFFKGAYFYINKITGYDPQTNSSVLIEMLKVPTPTAYTSLTFPPNNPPSGTQRIYTTTPWFTEQGNLSLAGSAAIGLGVVNESAIGLITGQNITTDKALVSFDAIGVKDQVFDVTFEGKTMIRNNGLLVSDSGVESDKKARGAYTTNFTINKPVSLVDASGGNINILTPTIDDLNEWTIIRIDNSGNVVNVTSPGAENFIQGGTVGTPLVIPTRSTRRIISNGTAWYY